MNKIIKKITQKILKQISNTKILKMIACRQNTVSVRAQKQVNTCAKNP